MGRSVAGDGGGDAKSWVLLFQGIFTQSAPVYVPELIRPSEPLRGDVAP